MSAITEAASVILARGPSAAHVLTVRRADSLRFFGGYFAFPGGKVCDDDAALPPLDARRAAAVRELFEETGVLLARRPDGSFPPGSEILAVARKELLAGALSFPAWLAESGLTIRADDLRPAGSLVTPPFSTMRFDTAFFVAELPPGQDADIWNGELSDGRWTTPGDLLDAWTRGDCRVTPPSVTLLELIRDRSVLELPERVAPLIARLAAGAIPPIPFSPGVHMLPLRSTALPPANYTNAFLVGNEQRWLIDPGAHEPAEQQRLLAALDELLARGGRFAGIVLTHWHPDHVGAVESVRARYGVPVLGHPDTARYQSDVRLDRFLHDGDRLDLGRTPDGSAPWHLQALLTPGHAAGHLAFYDPHYKLLFAADLVSPLTSIVIAPPDGNLEQYLDALARVRQLDCRLLLPGHGPPTIHVHKLLDDALAHRARREAQLVAALEDGPADAEELTARLYESLTGPLKALAGWQVQAGLEKLRREGRAIQADAARWQLTAHTIAEV